MMRHDRHVALVWQRAADRARTVGSGRDTRHSFSFGAHYDADNVGYGGLLVHNDDLLSPGAGYPEHGHVDVEIVTWVVSGCWCTATPSGGAAELGAGTLQVQSAGAGHPALRDRRRVVRAARGSCRRGCAPTSTTPRRRATVVAADPVLAAGGLVPLVVGRSGSGARAASARPARRCGSRALARATRSPSPSDPLQHVFVTRGAGRRSPAAA